MATAKNTKTNKNTAKAKKAEAPKTMTYPQAYALTNALFHSKPSTKAMSEKLDVLNANSKSKRKGMDAERKAEWLKVHGEEPASYAQCKAFAFGLLNAKLPYAKASEMIETIDKASGYQRQPKAEEAKPEQKPVESAKETVEKLNEKAKEQHFEQINLLDVIGKSVEPTKNA